MFTLPKLLRQIFSRRRPWLGELCRIAARLLADAYAEATPGARPGLILFVQTFGDLANFNPHLRVLAAYGVFGAEGTFIALPAVPEALLADGFRRGMLEYLLNAGSRQNALRSSCRHRVQFPVRRRWIVVRTLRGASSPPRQRQVLAQSV